MAQGHRAQVRLRAEYGKGAGGGGGALRDDIDDAIDGIGAPHGRAGAADDLDPFDILQHEVLGVPVHAREEWTVDAAAVDHHQQLVRECVVEAARRDRIIARIHPPTCRLGARRSTSGRVAEPERRI